MQKLLKEKDLSLITVILDINVIISIIIITIIIIISLNCHLHLHHPVFTAIRFLCVCEGVLECPKKGIKYT